MIKKQYNGGAKSKNKFCCVRKNCDKMIETVTKVQNLAIVGRVGVDTVSQK